MLFRQKPNRSKENKGKEGNSKFIITGSDSAKSFDLVKEAFYQMTLLVDMVITRPGIGHAFPGRDGVISTVLGNVFSNMSRSVCLVTQNIAAGDIYPGKQINRRLCVMHLPASEYEVYRVSQPVYDRMDFCGLSAPAVPDILVIFRIYCPFFAPALCGCALIEVLSMQRFS